MKVVIGNKLGLHARAAAQLVKTAEQFEAEVFLEKNGESVDAKSVLSLLVLECPIGTEVVIRASGTDSIPAVEAVAKLVEDRFGEE